MLKPVFAVSPGRQLPDGPLSGWWRSGWRPPVMALAVATILLSACQDSGEKQNIGTVIGGVGGAVAGSQFGSGTGRVVGAAAGTLLGAVLGSEVGKSLDRADQLSMERADQQALESNRSGQTTTWRNPDSGNYGTVTPQRTFENSAGQSCREYQQTVTVGGKQQSAYGTACRQPDGSWKIINY